MIFIYGTNTTQMDGVEALLGNAGPNTGTMVLANVQVWVWVKICKIITSISYQILYSM